MTAQVTDDGMNLDYPGGNTVAPATTIPAPSPTPANVNNPVSSTLTDSAPVQTSTETLSSSPSALSNGGQQISGPSFDDTASNASPLEPAIVDTTAPSPIIPDPAFDPASIVPPVAPEVIENTDIEETEEDKKEEKESPLQALARKLSELKSELIEETPAKEEKDVEEDKKNEVDLPLANVEGGDTTESSQPAQMDMPATLQTPAANITQADPVVGLNEQQFPGSSNVDLNNVPTDIPLTGDSISDIKTTPSDLSQIMPTETQVEQTVSEDTDANSSPLASTDLGQENVNIEPVTPALSEPSIEDLAQKTIPTPEGLVDPAALDMDSSTIKNENNAISEPVSEITQPAINMPVQDISTQQTVSTPSVTPVLPMEETRQEIDESDKTSVNLEELPEGSTRAYPLSISKILDAAIERNASDVHISVGYPVMLRIDGTLVALHEQIVSAANTEELILPVLSDQKKELLEVNREVDLAYTHRHGGEARFRINAYFTRENLSAAFRLIPTRIKSIEELKLPPIYTQFASLKQGLVLVTGPTGHGKSTTLAAILQHINMNRSAHVLTIEDPIEYIFPKAKAVVDQREMHDDTHSWAVALKSALRQDPDVILVGEMRDYETIAATITLAETGHLVFATLHTNSASQTIDRIIDVFPENQQAQVRAQLSNILEAVIAQRLIPVDGGGRRAVSEIMLGTPAVRNLIREGKTHQLDNVIRTSADVGMVPLEQSLVKLVREGLITMAKAEEYAVHPEEVVRLLKS